MNRTALSIVTAITLSTSATAAIDITQLPKLFDSNGTDVVAEFDLDSRVFSTILGGIKSESEVVKDGIGLFIYSPPSSNGNIVNNDITVYNDLLNQYINESDGSISFDTWVSSQTFDTETEAEINNLISNGLITTLPVATGDTTTASQGDPNLVILSNGVVTCSTANPGDILDDGNGNRYYVIDDSVIQSYDYYNADYTLIVFNVNGETFDLAHICTSLVTDMTWFLSYITIDADITNWDVSNVTSMNNTFNYTINANQDLSKWDVSNVVDMTGMFNSSDFNQPINNWNVSNVANMSSMFEGTPFNQDISGWNVSNVISMNSMFKNSSFNQNISSWNVSNVTDISYMFMNSPFNQPIGNWDVSNVTNMTYTFNGTSFNQDLNSWNTSSVVSLVGTFMNSPFNYDISAWTTDFVTNTANMFNGTPYNHPLDNWNMSNVTNMYAMFENSQFNQPLSNWDTSKVTTMERMFANNTIYDQDISMWNVSSVIRYADFDLNTNSNWIASEKPTFP